MIGSSDSCKFPGEVTPVDFAPTDPAWVVGPRGQGIRRGLRSAAVYATLFAVSGLAGPASAESALDLFDLQVFAKQSIRAGHSDFQGRTAAGEVIELHDFDIDGDLTAGRRISFERGQVKGSVDSPDIRLYQVLSRGRAMSASNGLDLASAKLDQLGGQLSALAATGEASSSVVDEDGTSVTVLNVSARRDPEVIDMTADQLASEGPGRLRLVLAGEDKSRLLIRVHGRSVRMQDVGFSVTGGLEPSRIAFLFPDATDLDILFSGGALDPAGKPWGIPGSVIAPNADLRFGAALVTGQVFVKAISPISGLPTGQVNRYASPCQGPVASRPTECFPPQTVVLRRKD